MKIVNYVADILVIVGGINWGLVGLLNFNLVAKIFGSVPVLEKIIYILVGISAIYSITLLRKLGGACEHQTM
ncbi:MAG: DUF378 domain-containing protein [Parcubacteria group bacterium]|nr:DUF378 domain-containing protein [Parcubacteria group bacterium]MCR4342719.1 DUF378 domain-containing protein [Patescibacteria group bacterium]